MYPAVTLARYMVSSKFWFQSFQNWQSEFLAILCIVLFTVYLRDRGSPQSKPVHAPHAETTGCGGGWLICDWASLRGRSRYM